MLIDGNPAMLVDLSTVGAQVVSATLLKPNQRVRLSFTEGGEAGALQRRRGMVGVRAAEGAGRAIARVSSSSTRTRMPVGRFCDTNRADASKRN